MNNKKMRTLKIFKEVALPSELQANSIYFVATASTPDYVEIYITGIGPSGVNNLHVDAVTKRHTHANKALLDKVGEDENTLYFVRTGSIYVAVY